MDGIHDLGGMEGFGAVRRDEEVFHAPWERTAFALAMTVEITGNTDDFRHSIERLDPAQYLSVGYYGRWLAAVEIRLRERGLLDSAEVDRRAGTDGARPRSVPSIRLPTESPGEGPLIPIDAAPAYHVGEIVRAKDLHPIGHTRLPRYVRGHLGVVAIVHPSCTFPDSSAHGLGGRAQYVYAVQFRAVELWGTGDHVVSVDLFESYLEPA